MDILEKVNPQNSQFIENLYIYIYKVILIIESQFLEIQVGQIFYKIREIFIPLLTIKLKINFEISVHGPSEDFEADFDNEEDSRVAIEP